MLQRGKHGSGVLWTQFPILPIGSCHAALRLVSPVAGKVRRLAAVGPWTCSSTADEYPVRSRLVTLPTRLARVYPTIGVHLQHLCGSSWRWVPRRAAIYSRGSPCVSLEASPVTIVVHRRSLTSGSPMGDGVVELLNPVGAVRWGSFQFADLCAPQLLGVADFLLFFSDVANPPVTAKGFVQRFGKETVDPAKPHGRV